MPAGPTQLSLELPAVRGSVPEARHAVTAYGESVDAAEIPDVAIAVSEAVGNAVVHAYRNGEDGIIRVRAEVEGSDLVVHVADDGVGMVPHPGSPGLRMGLSLIGAVTREVQFDTSARGLGVTMRFPTYVASAA